MMIDSVWIMSLRRERAAQRDECTSSSLELVVAEVAAQHRHPRGIERGLVRVIGIHLAAVELGSRARTRGMFHEFYLAMLSDQNVQMPSYGLRVLLLLLRGAADLAAPGCLPAVSIRTRVDLATDNVPRTNPTRTRSCGSSRAAGCGGLDQWSGATARVDGGPTVTVSA